jgi:CheY-like chemotaxis protein
MTKILLVEDDKSLREIYGVRLLAEGYDIVSAGDGEEALAMAIKEKPHLIVSDVMMPKISGFDMLDILRSTTETKDIKVIMMTALSSDDQRARGEQLGADRYLVKSQVGIEDVVRTVHEVLADMPLPGGAQPSAAPSAVPTPVATPTPVPSPVVTSPVPAPAPTTPLPAPTPAPAPTQPVTPLPQPTAPFSTPRPGNLGDRVIHPLEKTDGDEPNIADLMSKELNGHAATPAPSMPPIPPAPTLPPLGQVSTAPIVEPVTISSPPPPAPVTPNSTDSTSPAPISPTPPRVMPPPFGQ